MRNTAYKLLRKSEKFFKTDMVYLAKGGVWLLPAQVLVLISGVILAWGYANFLPKEIFGVYKYVLTLAALLGALSLTGLHKALVRSIARGFEGTIYLAFRKNLTWSGLLFAGALIVGLYYYFNGNSTLLWSMIIVGVLSPIINSAQLYTSLLNGKKDFRTTSIFGVMRSLLITTAVLVTVFFTNDIITIVLAFFVTSALVNLYFYHRALDRHTPNKEVDTSIVRYSQHLSLINILGTIAKQVDKVLVFTFLGPAQLATYAFVLLIPENIKASLKNISTLALPKLSTKDHKEVRESIVGKLLRFSAVLIPIVVTYIFAAPYIFQILFPEYMDAVLYSQIFAVGLLAPNFMSSTVFEAQKAVRENYIFKITNNLLRIVLISALFFVAGILGVVLARVIAKFASFALSLLLMRRI